MDSTEVSTDHPSHSSGKDSHLSILTVRGVIVSAL